jgi:hypothetical protein
MMTLAQGSRLADIARDLRGCMTHPSPHVRAAVSRYNAADVERSIEYIQRIIEERDGFLAHGIIKGWHDHGVAGVLAKVCGFR